MEPSEDKSASEASKHVCQPVPGVVATAAWGEGLVPFIDPTDCCEREDDHEDEISPRGRGGSARIEISRQRAAATEEVAEMADLVEEGNRWDSFDGGAIGGHEPQRPQPD